MKPLLFFLNENFSDQIKYFIVPNFGESEYNALLSATPIALLDGLMQISITTKDKPKDISPTSLEKNSSGWISIYKKFSGLNNKNNNT
jgi:hypothetical protein